MDFLRTISPNLFGARVNSSDRDRYNNASRAPGLASTSALLRGQEGVPAGEVGTGDDAGNAVGQRQLRGEDEEMREAEVGSLDSLPVPHPRAHGLPMPPPVAAGPQGPRQASLPSTPSAISQSPSTPVLALGNGSRRISTEAASSSTTPQTTNTNTTPFSHPPTTPQTANTSPPSLAPAKVPGAQAHLPTRPSPLSQSHLASSTPTPMSNHTQRLPHADENRINKHSSCPSITAHALHARFERNDARGALRLLLRDEPHYSMTDVEMRDSLWQLMDLMQGFAGAFFGFPSQQGRVAAQAFARMELATAKVIGCVASGGPGGVAGWHGLFMEKSKRQALVCAVLGNVLVEQVFGHVLFGGEAVHIRGLGEIQERMRDEDGFERNAQYASYIARLLEKRPDAADEEFQLPANFHNHVLHIITALWTHLKPIYRMGWVLQDTTPIPQRVLRALHRIVTLAGLLSLVMRLDRHTVYHFEPLFKEDRFDAERMDCYNKEAMQQRNPRKPPGEPLSEAEQVRRAGLSEAEKSRARMDRPLTQMILMAGVRAYRRGGWETPSSQAKAPVYEQPQYQRQGIRSRMLTQGWVYCRWGRAPSISSSSSSSSSGQAGARQEKMHGDAWDGGFLEFTDVEGVPDWRGMSGRESG